MDVSRSKNLLAASSRRETNLKPQDLLQAAEEGDIAAVWSFVTAGVDVNCRNAEAWTPLHFASYRGKVDVAAMLIREDADNHAVSKDGETPLHLAASNGQAEVAALLIAKGAGIEAKNKAGHTPMHMAGLYQNGLMVVLLGIAECDYEAAIKDLIVIACRVLAEACMFGWGCQREKCKRMLSASGLFVEEPSGQAFLRSYAERTATNCHKLSLEAMRLMAKYEEQPQKFDAAMAGLLNQMSGLTANAKPSPVKTLNDQPDQVAPIQKPAAAATPPRVMFDLNARRSSSLRGDRPHPGRDSRFWLPPELVRLDNREAVSVGRGGVRKGTMGLRSVDLEIVSLPNSDKFHPVVVSLVTAVIRILDQVAFCHHICKYAGMTQQSCYLLIARTPYQETLARKIARQRPGTKIKTLDALEIALAVSLGLEELHVKHLMHGHLTPLHILLPQKGDAVLALNFSTIETFSSSMDALQVTQEDQSDYYRPPELFPVAGRVKSITDRVDIWALGCVIVHMLTGKPPMCGCETSDILLAKRNWIGAKYTLDQNIIPLGLPKIVQRLLSRCFEHRPEHRPTAKEMIIVLRKGLDIVRAAARLAKSSMASGAAEVLLCCLCKERPYKVKFDHTVYSTLYSATAYGEGTYTVACEGCARKIVARGSICPVCAQPVTMAD